MKVRSIGANKTEVQTSAVCILVSYETPVAAEVDGVYFRTDQFWSVTTSKHINQWLDGNEAQQRPQSFFDNLMEG